MVLPALVEQQRRTAITDLRLNSIIRLGIVQGLTTNGFIASVQFGIAPNTYTVPDVRIPLVRTTLTVNAPMIVITGDLVAVQFASASKQSLKFIVANLTT